MISGNQQDGIFLFLAGHERHGGRQQDRRRRRRNDARYRTRSRASTLSVANNDTIGGTTANLGNIIANNGGSDAFTDSGVLVGGSQGIEVLSNTIYNNFNGGIYLTGQQQRRPAPRR